MTPEEVSKYHKQFPGDFCAASAHEFIMKLHDKVKPDAFPLQSVPLNESAGFSFAPFLKSHGIEQHDTHLDATTTMETIAEETAKGRYPLISKPERKIEGRIECHIYVAARQGAEIIIINPADGRAIASSTKDSTQWIADILAACTERPKIHILTYR